MLNSIESAMLTAKGYGQPIIEKAGRDFAAIATKTDPQRGVVMASALGKSPDDAARKLVRVVTRP